jgi:hypothetical protein
MSLIDKKAKEKEIAQFFAAWLSRSKRESYQISEAEEDRDIDYMLIEGNSKSEVSLQITTCDEKSIKGRLEAIKSRGEVITYDPDFEACIEKAIRRKASRYPVALRSKITLLVWSDFAMIEENYIKRLMSQVCKESCFREIYLVVPPQNSYPKNVGKVIPLKQSYAPTKP